MANILTGYDNFRYLALNKVEILLDYAVYPWFTRYTIEESVIAEGSGVSVEEIKIDNSNVGIKSIANIILAYSDFTAITLLSQFDEKSVKQITYYLKNIDGINVPDLEIKIDHNYKIHATINSKAVESEYNMINLEITVIDGERHITDIMTSTP